MNYELFFYPGTAIGYLTFAASCVYLTVGIYTYRKNRRSAINRHFLFLSLFFTLWALAASFAITAPSKEAAFFWFDTFSFNWFLFPPFFLHFFLSLSRGRFSFRLRHVLMYLPGIILIVCTTGSREIIKDFLPGPFGWYILYNRSGFWYLFNVLHYSLAIIVSLFVIIRWYASGSDTLIRKQAKVILLTFIPAALISSITGTVIPQLSLLRLPPLVPVIMVIWMLGISISVSRYRMLLPTWQTSANTIIEHIDESVLLLDRNRRIVFVNPAFTSLSGYGAAQAASMPLDTFFTGHIAAGFHPAVLLCANDAKMPVDVRIEPLYTEPGTHFGFLVVVIDRQLDEQLAVEKRLRKETAEQLRSSDILFTKAFYLSPIGMVIVDRNNRRIVEVNDAVLSMLGYDSSEITGTSFISHPFWKSAEDREQFLALFASGDRLREQSMTLLHKDGLPVDVKISAEGFTLFERQFLLFCLVDVSSQVNLERQILRMQRMESLGFLAGTVAHDLNNIFTALGGNLDLARLSSGTDNRDLQELIESAFSAYEKGRNLVRSILQFTRISEEPAPSVHILDVIREADELAFHGSPAAHRVLPPGGRIPAFRGFPDLLVQMFLNLYINARQAMQDSGSVTTAVEMDRNDVLVITVTDTGPGVPARYADHIFEKAFSTRKEGTGLGLAIVNDILGKHAGTIALNRDYHEGAQFILRIPTGEGR